MFIQSVLGSVGSCFSFHCDWSFAAFSVSLVQYIDMCCICFISLGIVYTAFTLTYSVIATATATECHASIKESLMFWCDKYLTSVFLYFHFRSIDMLDLWSVQWSTYSEWFLCKCCMPSLSNLSQVMVKFTMYIQQLDCQLICAFACAFAWSLDVQVRSLSNALNVMCKLQLIELLLNHDINWIFLSLQLLCSRIYFIIHHWHFDAEMTCWTNEQYVLLLCFRFI